MPNYNFSIEKILNITPAEYCASVGKRLSDYRFVGVHADAEYNEDLIQKFADAIPKEAEVVVNYRPHYEASISSFLLLFSKYATIQSAEGTALIPRK